MRIIAHLIALLLLCSLPLSALAATLAVRVSGVEGELLRNVLALLDIEQEKQSEDLSVRRIQRLHALAPQQIREALQPFGYYHVRVDAELTPGDVHWQAQYQISLGEPLRITRMQVTVSGEAQQDPQFQALLADFPLREGQVLVHARYEQARQTLQRLAGEQGYLDARLQTHEVQVSLAERSAQVTLHLDSGRRYRFGEVHFIQDTFDEKFLAGYVRFKPGDPYSTTTVLQLQTTLSDSGYFRWFEVRPLREEAVDGIVPIEITLEPRLPRQWRFGLGYGTDTGPRARISHNRRIGRQGHTLSGEVLASQNVNRFLSTYTIPLSDPGSELLAFSARYSEEETESRTSNIAGISASHITQHQRWRHNLSLSYEREDFFLGDEPPQRVELLYPIASWSRVRADNRIRPSRGDRLVLEVRGANDALLSDTSFMQVRANFKRVHSFGEDYRLLLRGDAGGTRVEDFDRLPASQRFFTGGDTSIRGFGYEEIGPRNAAGTVIGGKYLTVGSIELERRLAGNWSMAAFYDAGMAFNDRDEESLARGAGFGLRWNSPVGPIRLDFAWAVSKPDDDFRLHLVVGPDL